MASIRSYVVRIYRSSRTGMTGVVEDVQTGRTQAFNSVTELWQALRKRSPRPAAPRPGEPQLSPSENPSDVSPD